MEVLELQEQEVVWERPKFVEKLGFGCVLARKGAW